MRWLTGKRATFTPVVAEEQLPQDVPGVPQAHPGAHIYTHNKYMYMH